MKTETTDITKLANWQIANYLRDERHCALILWQTDDVIEEGRQMGYEISQAQANDIIAIVDKYKDCSYGISWETIHYHIDTYFNSDQGRNQ